MTKLYQAQGQPTEGKHPTYYRLTYTQGSAIVAGTYLHHPSALYATNGTTSPSVNILQSAPFIVARKMTIDRLALYVSTGVASGLARVGIYNSSPITLGPTSLIVDSGDMDVSTSATNPTATINVTLEPGLYFTAFLTDSAISVFSGVTQQDSYHTGFSPAAAQKGFRAVYTYGALPATYPVPTYPTTGNAESIAPYFRIASYP